MESRDQLKICIVHLLAADENEYIDWRKDFTNLYKKLYTEITAKIN